MNQNRIGESYYNKNNEKFTITEYFSSLNVTIQFEDSTVLKNKLYKNIVSGSIRNPNQKIINNIGYFGIGKFLSSHKSYSIWNNILKRCYCEKQQLKSPTYIGCSVDERWWNFQVFAEWYEQNYTNDFVVDKDILTKGNKIYGPDTCCFVPVEINNLFCKSNKNRGNLPIGVSLNVVNNFVVNFNKNNKLQNFGTYKSVEEAFNVYQIEKTKYIHEIANIWKDKISAQVYNALLNYKIEITD